MARTIEIDLQPIGRHVAISAEQTLLEAAQAAGVELVAVCGGTGTCATCRVRVISGNLTPVTANKEFELSPADLAAGYRRAASSIVTAASQLCWLAIQSIR